MNAVSAEAVGADAPSPTSASAVAAIRTASRRIAGGRSRTTVGFRPAVERRADRRTTSSGRTTPSGRTTSSESLVPAAPPEFEELRRDLSSKIPSTSGGIGSSDGGLEIAGSGMRARTVAERSRGFRSPPDPRCGRQRATPARGACVQLQRPTVGVPVVGAPTCRTSSYRWWPISSWTGTAVIRTLTREAPVTDSADMGRRG